MDELFTEIQTPGDLPEILRRARKSAGKTQRAISELAGISRQHLCEIEQGKSTRIELPTLLRILGACGLSLRAEPRSRRPTLQQMQRMQKIDGEAQPS